jgi:hypothetical protein
MAMSATFAEWWPVEQSYSGMERGSALETTEEIAPVVGINQGPSIVQMIEDDGESAESLGADLDHPEIADRRAARRRVDCSGGSGSAPPTQDTSMSSARRCTTSNATATASGASSRAHRKASRHRHRSLHAIVIRRTTRACPTPATWTARVAAAMARPTQNRSVSSARTCTTSTATARAKVWLSDYAERWIAERPGLRPRTVELYSRCCGGM